MNRVMIFAVVYSLAYIFLAFQLTDAGHGTTIFLAPLTPLGLPWLFLLAAFYLITLRRTTTTTFSFFLLAGAHYALTAVFICFMWSESLEGTKRIWMLHPSWVVLTSATYVSGHVVLWSVFYKLFTKPD